MGQKPKTTDSRLQAIAMLAVVSAIAAGPFLPEIAIGAGMVLGIAGCLDWLRDPP